MDSKEGFAAGVALGFLLRRPGDPRGRAGVFRPAGVALLGVLVLAAVQQVRHAAGGPYPERLPPFRSVISRDGTWKMDVPVFWESAPPESGETKFLDPLMAALSVERIEGRDLRYLIPKENERILGRGIRRVGTIDYYETYGAQLSAEGPLANYRFQRPVGEYNYVVTFECPLEEAESYQPLLNRMLESLQIAESPSGPGGDAPPAVPRPPQPGKASPVRVTSVRTCRACDRAFARRS